MISTLRKHQRWLLLLVAILTIIAFAWLYNTTDTEKLGENQVAQLYGKTIYRPEIDRAVRLQRLAALLGMEEFLRDLSVTASSEQTMLEDFVWNLLVLRHEAGTLFLKPTDEQVLEAIRTLPALSTDGQFDRAKYLNLLQSQLAPNGLTERHLEELIRDSLALKMVRRLLDSPLQITALEEKELRKSLQRIDAKLIGLGPLQEVAGVEVTEEDVKGFFQSNAEGMKTPEYRRVDFLRLGLTEEEAKLTGRERIEVLQKVADRMARIAEAISGGTSFQAAAQQAGIAISETPFFDQQGATPGEDPTRPGGSAGLPANVVQEAFRLAHAGAVGEILQDGGDFYLLSLKEVQAPRPLTEAEAFPRIREMLTEQKASSARQAQANAIRTALEAALASGKSLDELAKEKKLTVRELSGLEPWRQGMDENSFYARSVAELAPGKLSPVSRDGEGFYVLQVVARQEPTAELLASEGARMREDLQQSKRMLLFAEWLRSAREAANLRYFQRGS